MATHDYVIDNGTGSAVRADLNNLFKAILTNNSGTTDPSTVISSDAGSKAFSFWADTNSSPAVLKIRNAADDGWIELFQLDGTLTLEDGSASTPALAFRDDLNTGIFSSAADNFDIATGGSARVNISSSGLTVNNDLIITDKIIHSGDTNTLIRFPSNDNIQFDVNGSERLRINDSDFVTVKHATTAKLRIENSTAATSQTCMLDMAPAGTASGVQLKCVSDDDFSTGGNRTAHFRIDIRNSGNFSERLRIDSSGRLLLGTTTEGHPSGDDLTIATSGTTGITIRSGTSSNGNIMFSDGTSGNDEFRGHIKYDHSVNRLSFENNGYFAVIDSIGHVGIGVIPDDGWPSNGDYRALQIGTGACLFGRGSGDEDRGGFAVNYYATGSGNKFLANGHANLVYLNDGNINFYTSAQNSSGADADLTLIEVMEIKSNKDVEIKDGDLVIGTAGHGIDFSAQNTSGATGASTSNELLNHYEEGTWTPTTNGGTLSVATAHYVRVGTLVMAQCYVTFPSMSGGSEVLLQGYPFTTPTGNDFYSAAVNSDANLNTQLCGQFASTTMKFATENNSKANFNQLSGKFVVVSVVYSVH